MGDNFAEEGLHTLLGLAVVPKEEPCTAACTEVPAKVGVGKTPHRRLRMLGRTSAVPEEQRTHRNQHCQAGEAPGKQEQVHGKQAEEPGKQEQEELERNQQAHTLEEDQLVQMWCSWQEQALELA